MSGPGSVRKAVASSTPIAAACAEPTGTYQGLSEMDVRTLFNMTLKDRLDWYKKQLGAYAAQVRASASCNGIPPQLVATVILNELGDINWQDVWQQWLGQNGSLGVAQIQVSTAKAHKLVQFPSDTAPLSDSTVRQRLTIPQYAIEAAAREVRQILDRMTSKLSNPWQKHFAFTLTSVSSLSQPNDIYNHIHGSSQRQREMNLAEMVVAAYNSPGIVDAQKQASITPGNPGFIYRNGTIHGGNSRFIAGELFDANLFH